MHVSVETMNGLERKVTVLVPAEKIDEEFNDRLGSLAKKVKIDGFRPGKVPLKVVKQRYSKGILHEITQEMVQSTLYEALKDKELVPAGTPYIEPGDIKQGVDFEYTATFEIFPEITISELSGAKVVHIKADVADKDVDKMLERLREQHKTFEAVNRVSKKDDKLIIDFEGFIDGEAFEGGNAEGFELVLGSGSMIPGFEDGLLNVKKGDEVELNVTFPENYGHKDLAGKPATFKVKVNEVLGGQLPELNDAFAKKFNLKDDGGINALKEDIKKNMSRELESKVLSMNKEKIFDAMLEANVFDLPKSLIDKEIEHLQQEMLQRVFGDKKMDENNMPELPKDMFEKQAARRVHLGLLVSEYVKQNDIKPAQEKVDALLEKVAGGYEKPQDVINYYKNNKERMAELEAAAIEEQVVDKISENVTIEEKAMDYESVMNPQEKTTDDKAKE